MTLVPNDSHVQDALDNRIEQFKTKVRFGELLSAFVQQMQEAEDAALEILNETELNTSIGQQLDNLGEIVGEQRFGRNDTQYSAALAARIKLNLSNGTIEDILGLMTAVSAAPIDIEMLEFPPASFIADITNAIDPAVVDVEQINIFVKSGKPAGVRGLITFHVAAPFQFDTGLGYDEGKYGAAL